MDDIRLQRVSEAIREELTELIEYEMEDPRVEGISVTDVHISPDGKKARVMVALSGSGHRDAALEALEHARSYLRTQLAQRLQLRRIPDIHFELDAVVEPARLHNIISRIRRGRPKA